MDQSITNISPQQTSKEPTSLRLWVPLLVAVCCFLVFLPALNNDFVSWDDDKNFLQNPYYRGLAREQLRWMFSTFHMGHYIPLTWISLGLDYLIWGMNPAGYHLTNILLHTANAFLFYFVVLRLIRRQAASPYLSISAGLAALFFAIHPLRVESVAWVTERRDVLSGFFVLLTALFYLNSLATYSESLKSRLKNSWFLLSCLSFALALLCKASAMALPLILLILDWYPLKRIGWSKGWFKETRRDVWLEKIPFLVLSLGAAGLVLYAQKYTDIPVSLSQYGIPARLAQSGIGSLFYLTKTLFPFRLSPLYEMPVNWKPWNFESLASLSAAAFLTAILIYWRRLFPGVLAGWLSYLFLLAPVLGLVHGGPQMVAERYSYLSCMSWAILLGAGLNSAFERFKGKSLAIISLAVAAGFLYSFLGLTAYRYVTAWRNTQSLWNSVLKVNPNSFTAHNGLAANLVTKGSFQEAIAHLQEALRLNPGYGEAHNNLGVAYGELGDIPNATRHYSLAVKLEPKNPHAHFNLANVLVRTDRITEAIPYYLRVIEINPNYDKVHCNLGNALALLNDFERATYHYQQAIKAKPDFAQVYNNLGAVYERQGRLTEAAQKFEEALRYDPQYEIARKNLLMLRNRQKQQ